MIRPMRPAMFLAAALALSACAAPHLSFPKAPRRDAPPPPRAEAPAASGHKLFGVLPPMVRHPWRHGEAPARQAEARRAGEPRALAAGPTRLKPGEWAQARSDVAPDPDVRFGALSNGMRYAIRRQVTPPGQAALRLRFDAGSMMETDQQSGLAHFLEHMAFDGSKAVPEGEMIKILERHGLAFGADTNASTEFEQTQYKLDLPRTDDDTVDTSLMLLREAAGNLTLDPGAVDRERGVVLSEERVRDSPQYRIYKARLGFMLKDQLPPERLPIGRVEVLKSAAASQIADFYHRYYRPDRAVLVAVGDFDPDAMEAKIKARFSDWRPAGPAGGEPNRGAVQPRGPEARLVVEPGSPLFLQIAWLRPPEHRADSQAERRRQTLERLGFAVMNRRLSTLARAPNPPFLAAGAFRGDQYHAADLTQVAVSAEASHWKEAVAAVDQEQRRIVQYGVRQDELDREISEVLTSLRNDAAGGKTRTPGELANDIVDSLGDNEVVTSPAQDLAMVEAATKGLTADQVSDTLRNLFKGQGPLIFMTSPKPIDGGEATVLAAYQASQQLAVTAPSALTQAVWPYGDAATPGKVAETREVSDLDTVFVRFANGVRLTIKPTKFKDDEVLVRVNVGGGRVVLPRDRPSMAWAGGAYIEGGLAKISAEDMERVLANKVYGGRFSITDDAFVFSGETRPADLDVQLQILSAYLTEPGWRAEAFQRLKTSAKTANDQYEATDSGLFQRDVPGLLHPGDQRWRFPTSQDLAGARLEDFKALVTPALTTGSVEVVIVGDITVEKATDMVARTFGALPPRPDAAPAAAAQKDVRFPIPTAQPVELFHKGRADQAIGYVAWPSTDFNASPQGARDEAVMGEVLQVRLLQELRVNQGATYSPQVAYSHSLVWPGWGYVYAEVEVPPAKLAGFFTDVRKIAADLRARPPTPDELERAKNPRLENIQKARATNGYWLSELSGSQADPRRLDAIRAILPGTERVTAEDVQRAARRVLKDETMWRLEVKPEAMRAAAAGATPGN
jgi:zinc protease